MIAKAAGKRGYNLDFASIPIFDGRNKSHFHDWFRHTKYTCAYSKRDLRQELLQRSAGAVTTILLKMDKNLRNDRIKKILQGHFGERHTHTIPETCKSKIVIVAYINAPHDDIGRKLRSNIANLEDEPHHPKAIRTLCNMMDQAQRWEKEQNFTNLQKAEIMEHLTQVHYITLGQSCYLQKLMLSMVMGDTNQEAMETETM